MARRLSPMDRVYRTGARLDAARARLDAARGGPPLAYAAAMRSLTAAEKAHRASLDAAWADAQVATW